MGSWPAIVIQGRDVIKEALVIKGDDFSGRLVRNLLIKAALMNSFIRKLKVSH